MWGEGCGEGEEVYVPIGWGEGVCSVVYEDWFVGGKYPVFWCGVGVLWGKEETVGLCVLVECCAGEVDEVVSVCFVECL